MEGESLLYCGNILLTMPNYLKSIALLIVTKYWYVFE